MIYIVEDDRNIQEIEIFALKNSGYQAVGFETAKEFYGALSEKLPELILLDIMLPDEDGLSILKRLRTRADTQKIPVILVTAKSTEIDKVKGLDGGADDYIAKPFGVMEMIARVKALLRRSGGAEESLMTCGNVILDSEKRMVYVDGKAIELTYKEFELLKLLMKNPKSDVSVLLVTFFLTVIFDLTIAIEVGLPATDLKLITAVLFLIILIISMDRKKKVKA